MIILPKSIQSLIEIIPELKNLKIIDISDSLIGNKNIV